MTTANSGLQTCSGSFIYSLFGFRWQTLNMWDADKQFISISFIQHYATESFKYLKWCSNCSKISAMIQLWSCFPSLLLFCSVSSSVSWSDLSPLPLKLSYINRLRELFSSLSSCVLHSKLADFTPPTDGDTCLWTQEDTEMFKRRFWKV